MDKGNHRFFLLLETAFIVFNKWELSVFRESIDLLHRHVHTCTHNSHVFQWMLAVHLHSCSHAVHTSLPCCGSPSGCSSTGQWEGTASHNPVSTDGLCTC